MNNSRVSIFISAIAALLVSLPVLADFTQERLEAGRLYDGGQYSDAYKQYRELARNGDSFSQYRLSYMYLMGEGHKEDLIESLAWSVLAAQDRQQELVTYMQTVAGMVPQKQRKKANKKISYYMRKWGKESSSGSSRSDEECTGSRLCNHKNGSGNAGVPSNLWIISNNESSEQEIESRLMEINETILKSESGKPSAQPGHESS